ncbi:Polyadenylate-binding protein 8 [Sarracenia purpurea var. burkii]
MRSGFLYWLAKYRASKSQIVTQSFPLVATQPRVSIDKVTGMLLEMDQTEVLHLLESPDALKAKVVEAMEVLRNVAAQQQASSPTDQLAALSLNDHHLVS